ncbi:MAG: hypothetical protein VB142_09370 [Burkholderia sp.]
MMSITSKMMDTTLASIFTGVYDGHAESLTFAESLSTKSLNATSALSTLPIL